MSEFRFRFRDLECLTFGSETDSETRLEPRVSAFRFRDERTENTLKFIMAGEAGDFLRFMFELLVAWLDSFEWEIHCGNSPHIRDAFKRIDFHS